MGNRFGRNKAAAEQAAIDPIYNYKDPYGGQFYDPNTYPGYTSEPPGYSSPYLPPPSDPSGLGVYAPELPYGYDSYGIDQYGFNSYEAGTYSSFVSPTSSIVNYGELTIGTGGRNWFDQRYPQGFNQMQLNSLWNYGNHYLGNTTMQMIPFMLGKVGRFLQCNENVGGMGMNPSGFSSAMGFGHLMGGNMAFSGACNCPGLSTPFIMAATPLPVAYNPIIQGIYPMSTMSAVQMWNPMQFISTLFTGPMPYRPPTLDFPSNVGMVMTIPYGTSNPLLSPNGYNSIPSSFPNSCVCCNCSNAPPVSYSNPVMIPQPYPVPYVQPVEIAHINPIPASYPIMSNNLPDMLGQSEYPMSTTITPIAQPLPPSPYNNVSAPSVTPLMRTGVSGVYSGYDEPLVSSAASLQQQESPVGQVKTDACRSGTCDVQSRQKAQQSSSKLSHLNTTTLSDRNRKNGIFHKLKNQFSSRLFKTKNQNIYSPLDQNYPQYAASMSGITNNNYYESILPLPYNGLLISDSGWMPNVSTKEKAIDFFRFPEKYKRSKLFRQREQSTTISNEYDCEICKKLNQQHLRKYSNSSKLLSLSSRESRQYSPSDSALTAPSSPYPIKSGTPRLKKRRSHRRTKKPQNYLQDSLLNNNSHYNDQKYKEKIDSHSNSKQSSRKSPKRSETTLENNHNTDTESSASSSITAAK
ncbi:unnamed protein product [Didymodactylos carnosus]|uniref:Uncharacterized protein n=1 Tax=Didymodactylos carnosus TaxID=1234261 RepID=A0A814IJ33_9BILA|nr:unnamed protein product [Didymodactylos carnosus]CAF1024116.1 unnamed protein product [Didymodactylos carnosus]CAF3666974.1 unnamed protein product [Didymodactylos carnosus]CAF3795400.1 unnamed protein product [Didymodactylos carnosus]